MAVNFDDYKSGGVHVRHPVATRKLGIVSAFDLGQRNSNTTESRWSVAGSAG
jgi:hypothetical protein